MTRSPAARPSRAATPSQRTPSAERPLSATDARKADTSRWTAPDSYAPSLFAKIGDALGSRVGFAFYCGVYVGCMLTAVLALIWSRVLS
jgi:hypothetical protein